MADFLLQLLKMSAAGGVVALAVMLARLAMKRSPRAVVCALWLAVLVRLLCPFTIESAMGLFPARDGVEVRPVQMVTAYSSHVPAIGSGAELIPVPSIVEQTITPPISVEEQRKLVDWAGIGWTAGMAAWAAGCAILLGRGVFSLVRLKRSLKEAERYDENVFLVKDLPTAFVLGVVKPKIYLPAQLSERERSYILLHEHTHIRRGDMLWKLLGYAALCVHWFNPLVWLAFALAERDMEMACDEAVIRRLGAEVKKEYSASLLHLATGKHPLCGMPLAFGEGDTKGRVKNVLKYKQPAVWAVILAAALVVLLCVALISTQPKRDKLLEVNGVVYSWSGEVVTALPPDAVEIGMLESVLHDHRGDPERSMQATNIDESYAGCMVYFHGDSSSIAYLADPQGGALLYRATKGIPVGGDVKEEALRSLLGTQEEMDIFFVMQEAQGRYFVGYTQGRDMGVAALSKFGSVLESHALVRDMADSCGVTAVSLTVEGESYDALLVTDPAIHNIYRNEPDLQQNRHMNGSVPALYVFRAGGGDVDWDFTDENDTTLNVEWVDTTVEAVAPSEYLVSGVEHIAGGEVVFSRTDFTDAENEYLDFMFGILLAQSAAWPVDGELPDEYIVLNRGDAISGMRQTYYYVLPETGKPVAQNGNFRLSANLEHWMMLQSIVAGEEQPHVFQLCATYDDRDLQGEVLADAERIEWAESVWDAHGGTAQHPIEGEGQRLVRVGLDGTRGYVNIPVDDPEGAFFEGTIPSDVLPVDMNGDGAEELVYWAEDNLWVLRGDGVRQSFPLNGIWVGTLFAADVTGDGLEEIVAMADTGGVGGWGSYNTVVLTYREVIEELPLPYRGDDPENAWASGYEFTTTLLDGFRLRVQSDKMDEIYDLSGTNFAATRIDSGHTDALGNVQGEKGLHGRADGICIMEPVAWDERYALRLYQYLYADGHSDGIGMGVTTVVWNTAKNAFLPMEQEWVADIPHIWRMDQTETGETTGIADVKLGELNRKTGMRSLIVTLDSGEVLAADIHSPGRCDVTVQDVTGDGKAELLVFSDGSAEHGTLRILAVKNGKLVDCLTQFRDGAVYDTALRDDFLLRVESEGAAITVKLNEDAKRKYIQEGTYTANGKLLAESLMAHRRAEVSSVRVLEDGGLCLRQVLFGLRALSDETLVGEMHLKWNGKDFELMQAHIVRNGDLACNAP